MEKDTTIREPRYTKALLLSIKAKHVFEMYHGTKKIEVRTFIPNWVRAAIMKGEKVIGLIYITKEAPYLYDMYPILMLSDRKREKGILLNGSVAFAIEIDKIVKINKVGNYFITDTMNSLELQLATRLRTFELLSYMKNHNSLFGLHIEKIEKFYQKPLNKFVSNSFLNIVVGDVDEYKEKVVDGLIKQGRGLSRAPQSMQAVWQNVYTNKIFKKE